MGNHPFKDFHEDCKIGNLMWRISRRRDMDRDSQDGVRINDLQRKIANDQYELDILLAAYNSTVEGE